MLVQGHFRGRAHAGAFSFLKKELIPELFEKCYKASQNKDFPPEFRTFALEIALKLNPIRGSSIGDTFENDIMKLIFNATAIANIADNAASSPLTNLFVAGHTADPGETGTAATSEIGYTSYARATVARTSGGWTVTNNSVSPVAAITFAAGTGGAGTMTHASITTVVTVGNASKILFSGTVTPNIVCGNGVTPSLPTSSTITID